VFVSAVTNSVLLLSQNRPTLQLILFLHKVSSNFESLMRGSFLTRRQ